MSGVIATYNVHRCIGADGRRDPARTAEVIREIDADILGLQEVESHPGIATGGDPARSLATAGGYDLLWGPTLFQSEADYGNCLLTRAPVIEHRLYDLGGAPGEPRGLIDARLELSRRTLRVLVTHLGLRRRQRIEQVERLLRILGEPDGSPTVVLGDFNEWNPLSRHELRLRARLGRTPILRTFPTRLPLLPLDRIWARPSWLLSELRVHRSPLARWASDHLAVRAEIRLSRTDP